jgi:hypothetical protein
MRPRDGSPRIDGDQVEISGGTAGQASARSLKTEQHASTTPVIRPVVAMTRFYTNPV